MRIFCLYIIQMVITHEIRTQWKWCPIRCLDRGTVCVRPLRDTAMTETRLLDLDPVDLHKV